MVLLLTGFSEIDAVVGAVKVLSKSETLVNIFKVTKDSKVIIQMVKVEGEAYSKIKYIISTKVDDLFGEAKRILNYADSYEVETMEGLKFHISKSDIDTSKIDDIDNIATKMAKETFNKNPADPFRDVLGSGLQSNPGEWNDITSKIEQAGGSIRYSDNGTMAYSPASQGVPGEIIIDRNASFSALSHEYQHFLDDMANGWSGRRIMYEDFKERIMWELRAYMKEIKEADRLGLQNVSNQLWENYLAERYNLISRIKPIY